jgi:hypothetical protein
MMVRSVDAEASRPSGDQATLVIDPEVLFKVIGCLLDFKSHTPVRYRRLFLQLTSHLETKLYFPT